MPMDGFPPSIIGSPKPGYSPGAVPSGNPGEVAAALAQIRQAVNLLQSLLPKLPIGSEPHKAVMESVTKLSKIVPASGQPEGVGNMALKNLQTQQQQAAPLQALLSSMGQRGGGLGGVPQGHQE